MSYEDIQAVTRAEQDTGARKAQAQVQAREIVAQAHKSGAAAVEQAKAQAQAQVKDWMAQAERRAGERAAKAAADNEEACQALRQTARAHMDEAADLIVRRVVEI